MATTHRLVGFAIFAFGVVVFQVVIRTEVHRALNIPAKLNKWKFLVLGFHHATNHQSLLCTLSTIEGRTTYRSYSNRGEEDPAHVDVTATLSTTEKEQHIEVSRTGEEEESNLEYTAALSTIEEEQQIEVTQTREEEDHAHVNVPDPEGLQSKI
ncbi:hypothetical protein K7X08_020532 [Anisodus acutangulus]|uniref:Uncharacterized protein n=1 Tax=Anisodus acutangulus TaxID=402998 RepID=A0A9Q1M9M6_9SOLA|nr:hypothetical protein K7X08_020532 [Anisodus acutangulus]